MCILFLFVLLKWKLENTFIIIISKTWKIIIMKTEQTYYYDHKPEVTPHSDE